MLSAHGRVAAFVGVGLVIVGFLEGMGLITYRSHREPVGTAAWLIFGFVLIAVGWLLARKG